VNERELQALKGAFGLADVSDPAELRTTIEKRLAGMNALDRAALNIDIGRRIAEIEAHAASSTYSPATWSLLATAAFSLLLAGVLVFAAFQIRASLTLRVAFALFAVLSFLVAWRATARVVYRWANNRDM